MKTDKVILGILGGLCAGAILGYCSLLKRGGRKKIKIKPWIMLMS
jgi:hypothetical protein